MQTLKGFVTIKDLISNVPDILSPIGEISTWALTFTKDRGEFTTSDYPDYRLVSVSSKDQSVNPPVTVQIDSGTATKALSVAHAIYNAMSAGVPSKLELITQINSNFNDITLFDCGSFVSSSDSQLQLPEWYSYTYTYNSITWNVRIWMADSSFREQFDEFDIVVIPPVTDINSIATLSPTNLASLIAERSYDTLFDLIQEAKDEKPETYVRSVTYNYTGSGVSPGAIKLVFSVIIYGKRGDNTDSISEAIQNYIDVHADSANKAAIRLILPDLYLNTEFIFLPRWDKVAIADLTIQQGIFSPIVELTSGIDFLKNNIGNALYTDAHIAQYGCGLGVLYRSLALVFVGSPENRNGNILLTSFFPDFTNIPALTPLDYQRMGDNTRLFIERLNELVVLSDSLTDATVLPSYIRRTYRTYTRSGVTTTLVFLSSTIAYVDLGRIEILVCAKSNFTL